MLAVNRQRNFQSTPADLIFSLSNSAINDLQSTQQHHQWSSTDTNSANVDSELLMWSSAYTNGHGLQPT